ncbi:NACHT domain-containing protein [Streptomyces lincolnensis]|uniref:NACHT domain-containing protein n=1 Tax=Streptomyces lincolnensis TaxID=1915 RepID=UPI001E31A872|nr:NACHT domain-containing protein [Streptomyces lincolnensis]MCD7439636.1 NACHT domain-containing protein [Streptomyces lincolnensis]
MIGGRVLDRVVVVLGAGQGTGVLLDRRTVMTARHVIEGVDAVEVIHPAGDAPVMCTVLWADRESDVALLQATDDVISAGRAAPLGSLRVGTVATWSPLAHCQIVGFPQIQRYGERHEDLEYDQYRAAVLPMAGHMRDVLVCELDRPAADERDGRTSPFLGLSGAPVFAGAVLLGVVTQVPKGRHHMRVEAVSVEPVLDIPANDGWGVHRREMITDVHPQDDQFEIRYAADLRSQYRKTEIFGIDELGRSEASWDLDTAYLSLEADGSRESATRRRIDTLLTGRPRVLLRGEAGAGKTTLVWWLAAHAANGTLDADLAELNGLVPFVVPLREVHARGGRFPAVSELLSAGRVIGDAPPEGWVRRVLEAGRGLLLVDGLDEVPEREREEARRWLSALLDRYSHTRCVATVRPNAVEKDWLARDGFEELTLLPMSDEDISAFVGAWHDAARLECDQLYDTRRGGEERQHLSTLEEGLIHQLADNTALSDLARTPLLCAVICALHRRRGGLLPTTRWSLYQAALAMLLGGRDAGRGVRDTSPFSLDSGEQHALLQRLAIWLARTGQQQMTHAQAMQQLGLAMRDMSQIAAKGTPEEVLRFLLDRSGLLQEHTDDAIQFIHRTFQDFLAAKEFHESGYILELLERARDEVWRDVIVLAVGHATRKDTHELIEKLVEFGDEAVGGDERRYLHLLAAACATSVLSLDAGLMERVRERVRAMVPPASSGLWHELAALGDWVVDLLPGPDGLDEDESFATASVLVRIRSTRARRALKAFASASRELPADGWSRQPIEEYAREVLYGIDLPYVYVNTRSQLVHLRSLDCVSELEITGSYSAEDLDAYLPTHGVRKLQLSSNGDLASLDFLKTRTELMALNICAESLTCERLRALEGLPELRSLELVGTPLDGWSALPPLPGVSSLKIADGGLRWFAPLGEWTGLEELDIYEATMPSLARCEPLPRIRSLDFPYVPDTTDIAQVRRVFPGLKSLALVCLVSRQGRETLDLTPLLDLPGLRVTLHGPGGVGLRIVGAEEFGDRLTDLRDPRS